MRTPALTPNAPSVPPTKVTDTQPDVTKLLTATELALGAS
jgi:hypothetical protein